MAFLCSGGGGGDLGLGRTSHEKYAHYMPDGHGRDSYIIRNNGGLCSERDPYFRESTRFPSPMRFVGPPAHRKEVWSIKYVSDGSGRDSYVLINSGGNHVNTQLGGTYRAYENSLRRESFVKSVLPSKQHSQTKRDFHYWQSWFRPEHQNQMRKSVQKSKKLFERLATPKKDSRIRSSTPSVLANYNPNEQVNYLAKSVNDFSKVNTPQNDIKIKPNRESKLQLNTSNNYGLVDNQSITRRFINSSQQSTRNKSQVNLLKSRIIIQDSMIPQNQRNKDNDLERQSTNKSTKQGTNLNIDVHDEFALNNFNHMTQDNRQSNTQLIGKLLSRKSRQEFNQTSKNKVDPIINMKQNNEEGTSVNVLDNLKQLMRQRRTLYTQQNNRNKNKKDQK